MIVPRALLPACVWALLLCSPIAASAHEHQGIVFLVALKNVYDLSKGTDSVLNDGQLYFVPRQPGLAPVLVAGTGKGDVAIEEMLRQVYLPGTEGRYPAKDFNPGRLRNEALLQFLYGSNAAEVQASCDTVDFFGQKVLFNRRQGAADALKRVIAKLKAHLTQHPQDKAYITPSPGTFAWRPVKDTGRLSAHAFGIAIDLNAGKGLYWMWNPPAAKVESVRKDYPQAIVDAFESEGFIWGGKWDAFDFMHFEYRPELHFYARHGVPGAHFPSLLK